jgi:hypothetical protein
MSAIKKLIIINFLFFNSIQTFTMSWYSSHKQDQSENLPASVDVHINNKLPHFENFFREYVIGKNFTH